MDPFHPQGAAQIGAVASHVAGDALVKKGDGADVSHVPSIARTATAQEYLDSGARVTLGKYATCACDVMTPLAHAVEPLEVDTVAEYAICVAPMGSCHESVALGSVPVMVSRETNGVDRDGDDAARSMRRPKGAAFAAGSAIKANTSAAATW